MNDDMINKESIKLGSSFNKLFEEYKNYIGNSSNELGYISIELESPSNISDFQHTQKILKKLLELADGTGTNITKNISIEQILVLERCTDELIDHLKRNPKDLYSIQPQAFEELVAAIFKNEGFDTELLGSCYEADGGVDIIAVRKQIDGIDQRVAIQCKRYSYQNRVDAKPIRELAGVLDKFHAHSGVVTTTSYFTKNAKDEVIKDFWRINLQDYNNIVDSLKRLDMIL